MTDAAHPPETSAAASEHASIKREPTNQARPDQPTKTPRQRRRPAWMRDLPQWGRFQPEEPNQQYQLLEPNELNAILSKYPPDVQERVRADLAHMEEELLPKFRERDHAASFNQNRYRKYQILYIVLAALATMIGSFQALALFSSTRTAMIWGFLETVIALMVTFLAVLISRESPLNLWLLNRRRAEQMRREYFRYLVNLPPYTEATAALTPVQRRRRLSRRAADINRGVDPDQARGGAEVR